MYTANPDNHFCSKLSKFGGKLAKALPFVINVFNLILLGLYLDLINVFVICKN